MSIYFYGCITIDGFLADKNHDLGWLYETGTPQETSYDSFYKEMDVTIMGRRTFNEIASQENPHLIYPTTENYVFTHSKSLAVKNFLPISGDVVQLVRSFSSEKNIWIVGGNELLATLLNSDMIDFMIIQIAPVLLGDGIPLFNQDAFLKRFVLEDVKQYGQFAELIYRNK